MLKKQIMQDFSTEIDEHDWDDQTIEEMMGIEDWDDGEDWEDEDDGED